MADNLLNSSFRLIIDFKTEAAVSQWGDEPGPVLHVHSIIGLYVVCGLFVVRLDSHSARRYKERA